MATWQGLGLVTPTLNQWQILPIASIGGETFRVTFINLGTNPQNRKWTTSCLIDSLYATDESGSSVRVYPAVEKEVIFLPIPPELKNAGLIVRYLRVKKLARYGIGRTTEPGWSIEVEEFIQ